MTERENLIQLLKNDNCPSPMLCSGKCKYVSSADCHAERLADLLIENDVVEVVRCKDCLHCYEESEVFEIPQCFLHDIPVYPDDFCSYGKKRRQD